MSDICNSKLICVNNMYKIMLKNVYHILNKCEHSIPVKWKSNQTKSNLFCKYQHHTCIYISIIIHIVIDCYLYTSSGTYTYSCIYIYVV